MKLLNVHNSICLVSSLSERKHGSRTIWHHKLSKENFPGYRCPRCHSHLALEDFSEEDNAETQRDQRDPDFDADWVVRGFRADLRCKSDRCGERVLCVGTGAVDTIHDQSGEGWDVAYVDRLTPQFSASSRSFELPPTTPREVRDSVLASFKLLFLSSGARLTKFVMRSSF